MSDNSYVTAKMRGPAASSASEANDLPDELMDVPQIADYPHVSKMSVTSSPSGRSFPQ